MQSCLKWKLFSKSRGTGDTRTIMISKTEIPLEDQQAPTSDMFDASKDHINAPLKAWLDGGAAAPLELANITKEELRYMYQLSTTFGFHPTKKVCPRGAYRSPASRGSGLTSPAS